MIFSPPFSVTPPLRNPCRVQGWRAPPPRLTAVKTWLTPRPISQSALGRVCSDSEWQLWRVAGADALCGSDPRFFYAGPWLRLLTSQQVLSRSAVRRRPVSHVGLLLPPPRTPRSVIQHSICWRREKQEEHKWNIAPTVVSAKEIVSTWYYNSWNHKSLWSS